MADFRGYLRHIAEDVKGTNEQIKKIQEAVAVLQDTVQSLSNDSEANAQAIVELAEIIGGDENG